MLHSILTYSLGFYLRSCLSQSLKLIKIMLSPRQYVCIFQSFKMLTPPFNMPVIPYRDKAGIFLHTALKNLLLNKISACILQCKHRGGARQPLQQLCSWRTCRPFPSQQKEPSVSRQQGSFLRQDGAASAAAGSKCQQTFNCKNLSHSRLAEVNYLRHCGPFSRGMCLSSWGIFLFAYSGLLREKR